SRNLASGTLTNESSLPAICPLNNNLSSQQQPYLATQSLPLHQQPYLTTQQLYSTTQQPYLTTQQPYSATQQPYPATQLYMDSLTLNEATSKYKKQ
ncbi:15908_t:CDS:1, partial [Dentiscutata heterogama]